MSHNRLRCLSGVDCLASLRTLDVGHNVLGRLEELAGLRGASLLSSLDTRGNPMDRVGGCGCGGGGGGGGGWGAEGARGGRGQGGPAY